MTRQPTPETRPAAPVARPFIEDRVCLVLPGEGGRVVRRHWRLQQPSPLVAFSLRGRIAACLDGAVDLAVRETFRALDPQAEADLEADTQTVGEAAALRAWRRARAGQCLVDDDGTAPVGAAGDVLRAVLAAVAARCGVRLDHALLLGEAEREEDGAEGYRWVRPSLLHRLLLDSRLSFDGEGPRPRTRSWLAEGEPESPGRSLSQAVASGSISEFCRALDACLWSADEAGLLAAWAVLTLWRPF
jgi:hypothetical protein